MKITGMNAVVAALKARGRKMVREPYVSVIVGYSVAYAIHVHENIEMAWRGLPRDRSVRRDKRTQIAYYGYEGDGTPGLFWGPNGQAKFLEAPARQLASNGTLTNIINTAMMAGRSLTQALILAGLRIQRESQKIVPVLTGTLKNSAFTVAEPYVPTPKSP